MKKLCNVGHVLNLSRSLAEVPSFDLGLREASFTLHHALGQGCNCGSQVLAMVSFPFSLWEEKAKIFCYY